MLAGILLLPFSVLMLIVFNVYLRNWIYLAGVTVLALIYSLLFGMAFNSLLAVISVFVLLAVIYVVRMRYLARQFQSKYHNKSYRALKGRIKSKNFNWRAELYFPLQFLHLLRLLPHSVSQKLMEKTNLDIGIPELVDRVLFYSLSTQIEVVTEDVDMFFEVK